jgi:hypothetical protein
MPDRRSRPLPPLAKATVVGSLVGFGLLLASVFATGSTFGQRCDRAYPTNALEAERCVERLAHGDRP